MIELNERIKRLFKYWDYKFRYSPNQLYGLKQDIIKFIQMKGGITKNK